MSHILLYAIPIALFIIADLMIGKIKDEYVDLRITLRILLAIAMIISIYTLAKTLV